MELVKILLLFTILTIIPGQLVRFPIFSSQGAITLSDLSVLLTDAVFLIYAMVIKKSLRLPKKFFIPILLFILAAIMSTILALNTFTNQEVIISALFLVRFLLYSFLTIVSINVVSPKKIMSWINVTVLTLFAFVILGFIQFIVVPDLSYLVPFGWDPHYRRIVSTLLDPNFSGYIFTVLLTLCLSMYVFKKKTIYVLLSIITFTAVALTFSRSSYLAMATAVGIIGILKSPKVIMIAAILGVLSFFFVPQVRSRVEGAFSIDDTSQARIESWRNAVTIYKDNPVFGVGFNTYRFAQARYGFFNDNNPLGGHSGSGSDSSLLLTAATTGSFGLVFYILLQIYIGSTLFTKARKDPLHLAAASSFGALLVHSQFVNSFFFPQIMILVYFLLGLALIGEKE